MKILRLIAPALIAVVLTPVLVLADNYQHEDAGVQFDAPDSWDIDSEDGVFSGTSGAEEAGVVLAILDAESVSDALDSLDAELEAWLDDVKVIGEAETVQLNGMTGVTLTGTGLMEDTDQGVSIVVTLVDTTIDTVLLVLSLVTDDVSETELVQLSDILDSIRPISTTHTHDGAGLSFDAPFDWDEERNGDVLELAPDDGSLSLLFQVVDANSIELALEVLEDELDDLVDDLEMNDAKTEELTINGLPVLSMEGDGRVEGVKIELAVALVGTPTGKVLLIVGLIGKDADSDYDDEIRALLLSLRAATGTATGG